MTRHRWLIIGLFTTAVLAVVWRGTLAQPQKPDYTPQQLHPADAVAYLQYDGTQADQEAWQQTAGYEALVKSGLWDAAHEWLTAVLDGQSPGTEVQTIALHGMTHGFSVSVTTMPGEKGPEPCTVFVLHQGAKLIKEMTTILTAAEATGETAEIGRFTVLRAQRDNREVEWTMWDAGEHLVFTFGPGTVERANQLIDGTVPDITQARLWKSAQEAPPDVVLNTVGWVDMQRIRETVGEVSLAAPNSPFKTVNDFLQTVGLRGLEELIVQQGFEGRNTWSRSVLSHSGPRFGVMEFFNGPAFGLDDLPPVSESSSSLYAMSLDLGNVYDAGWKLIRELSARFPDGPQDVAEMETALAKFEENIGLNVRDDILAGFGSLHVLYSDAANAFGGVGVGVVLQVKDAAKVRKVFDQLTPLIPNNPNGPRFARSKKRGRELLSFGQPGLPFWPTVCVEEKWLIVGLTPQVVDSFLLRLDGQLPAWKPDAHVEAALQGWPQEFLSLSVSDPRVFITGMTQAAPMMLAPLQAARQQAGQTEPLPELNLPAAELIAQPLYPNVGLCAVENGQIVWRSRQSVPSVPLVGGLDAPSIGTTAIAVALLLPAVQQAREAARRTQSRNNLKQLALSLHNYHDKHGHLPVGTVVGSAEKPEDRLSWCTQILPFLDQQALADQINVNEAWNKGANQRMNDTSLTVFLNPSSPAPPQFPNRSHTDYVGVAGLGVNGPHTKVDDKGAGMFAYDQPRKFSDVHDGTSNTLMLGDVGKNVGPWMQGGPATIRAFTQQPYLGGPDGYGGIHIGGANFSFADGSVRFVSDKIAPKVLESMTTIRGGETVGIDP